MLRPMWTLGLLLLLLAACSSGGGSDRTPDRPPVVPVTCPDGTTVPSGTTCLPVACPDGTTVPNGRACQPVSCPDGTTVPNGETCQPVSCPDGSTVPNGETCAPVSCPDGTTVPNGATCPRPYPARMAPRCPTVRPAHPYLVRTATTVPNGQTCAPVVCPDGTTLPNGATCPTVISRLPFPFSPNDAGSASWSSSGTTCLAGSGCRSYNFNWRTHDPHYGTSALPVVGASDVERMPVYHDHRGADRRLFVGVDQGTDYIGQLADVGERDNITIRYGRTDDGAGEEAVSAYLSEAATAQYAMGDGTRRHLRWARYRKRLCPTCSGRPDCKHGPARRSQNADRFILAIVGSGNRNPC